MKKAKQHSGDIQTARADLEAALRLLDRKPTDLRALAAAGAFAFALGMELGAERERLEAQARGREPRVVEVAGRRFRVLEGGAGR